MPRHRPFRPCQSWPCGIRRDAPSCPALKVRPVIFVIGISLPPNRKRALGFYLPLPRMRLDQPLSLLGVCSRWGAPFHSKDRENRSKQLGKSCVVNPPIDEVSEIVLKALAELLGPGQERDSPSVPLSVTPRGDSSNVPCLETLQGKCPEPQPDSKTDRALSTPGLG
ncbi:hypothetical protein DUI87_23654 [Hirundo rustica rustica]|uniref:Uncharacterized protein n=1 Tax=Hirundo rustica rustica TaxID=333673 RepID=A0A3M0JY54_HIRRU|nr:hypothetical protein DUI87_23654 [Hirundo rustica rustica]